MLFKLRSLGRGFPADHLIGFNVDPALNGYDANRSKAFYLRLAGELAALPGVQSAGLASMRILEDNEWDSGVTVEGATGGTTAVAQPFMNSIGPGYFATMGVPIIAGRD